MIKINSLNRRSVETNDENSLLIIGKGESAYRSNEIVKFDYIEDVEYSFGEDSELTLAYKEAYSIGARNIYLCNCYKYTDYVQALNLIASNEYTYITPLFNFSDTIVTNDNNEYYLAELYSNILGDKLSQLFITDRHASLYEDINHYILEMNKINKDFKESTYEKLPYGDNLCFVLNILQKYNFANVTLASILVQSDLRYYPQMDVGDVIFDINNKDVSGQEITYFAYDNLAKTSIENFLNYCPKQCPEKYVPINLIKQIISRKLDFSEYAGALYNAYMKIRIENKTNTIMSQFTGKLIEKYTINRIDAVKYEDQRISIYIYLSIKPYNSIENIDITLEV